MTTLDAAAATDLFRQDPDDWIDVGAGEAAYRRVGSGPDVLFVHGWPVSGATFRTLLPHLADHVTCHVIDLPGAGSSRFDAGTTIDGRAAHRERPPRRRPPRPDDVAVVGHDSGGLIARHAVAGDPRLRAMGLIDTEQPQGLSWRFRRSSPPGTCPGSARRSAGRSARPRLRRNPLRAGRRVRRPVAARRRVRRVLPPAAAPDPARLAAAGRLLRSFDTRRLQDLEALHHRIDVPVQLVWGEQDAFFPAGLGPGDGGTFPDAHLHVVPDAGLFSHEERPLETAQALLPTLARQRHPSR